MGTVYDYQTYTNVAGGTDVMNKMRSFAASKGWTCSTVIDGAFWTSNPAWGEDGEPQYYWNYAYNNCWYGTFESTGQGGTALKFRLTIMPGRDESAGFDYFHIAGVTGFQIDTNEADSPYYQEYDGDEVLSPHQAGYDYRRRWMHIGSQTIDRMWVFGDSKWICCVLDMNGIQVQAFHFGQYDMFESNPPNGMVYGAHTQASDYGTDATWMSHRVDGQPGNPWYPSVFNTEYTRQVTSHDLLYSDTRLDGYPVSSLSGSTCYQRCMLYTAYGTGAMETGGTGRFYDYISGLAQGTDTDDCWPNYWKSLTPNNYSGKRPMMRIVWYRRSYVDSTWRAVMKSNQYMVNFTGLAIGSILEYGTQQYIVFPIAFIDDFFGYALRIA